MYEPYLGPPNDGRFRNPGGLTAEAEATMRDRYSSVRASDGEMTFDLST